MRFKYLIFFIILLIAVLCGCNENPPEIRQVFWQFNVFHDQMTGISEETLSFYVMAEDKDGLNDIESLYLINDDAELFWKISGSDLHFEGYGDNELWVGNSSIKITGCLSETGRLFPDNHIPDGKYRVVLIDSSGERDETKVVLKNNIPDINHSWPRIEFNGNDVKVIGTADYIWAFNDEQIMQGEYTAKPTQVIESKNATNYYLYKYFSETGYGLITGPFKR